MIDAAEVVPSASTFANLEETVARSLPPAQLDAFAVAGSARVHRPLAADETLAEIVREPGALGMATWAAAFGGPSISGGVVQLSHREPR